MTFKLRVVALLLLHNPERGRKRILFEGYQHFTDYYYITPKGDGNCIVMWRVVWHTDYYYMTPKGDGN